MECLLKSSALKVIRHMTKSTQSHLIRSKTPGRNYRGGSIKTLLPRLPGLSTSKPVKYKRFCLWDEDIQNAYKSG